MRRMLTWLVTIMLAISLIAIVAVFLFNSLFNDTGSGGIKKAAAEPKKLSADQLVAVTSDLKDIKRNIKDDGKIVIVSLAFQLDKKSTKTEFDKIKDIAVKPVVNKTLADMTAEELKGSKGQDRLEAKLLNLINPVLPEGKLVKVDVTDFIMTDL